MGAKGSGRQDESKGLGSMTQRLHLQKRQTCQVPFPSGDSHWSCNYSGEPMSYRPKERLVAATKIQCLFVGTILGGKRRILSDD